MKIEIIEHIEVQIINKGVIFMTIIPKHFGIISREESATIVANEILNILGHAPIDLDDFNEE